MSFAQQHAGFNHNVRYRGLLFHVQTEVSGAEAGHIHTHIFHGGQVVSSAKLDYDARALGESPRERVGRMMRESHKLMTLNLCRGLFDDRLNLGRDQHPLSAVAESRGESNDRLQQLKEALNMDNIMTSLNKLSAEITGILGAALVDYESGLCLGAVGNGGINIEIAAAGNMEVVRAKKRVMRDLGIEGQIEDILITLVTQYHIIRPVGATVFLYVAFDRKVGNLALARHKMAAAGTALVL